MTELREITAQLNKDAGYRTLVEAAVRGGDRRRTAALAPTHLRPLLVAGLAGELPGPLLVVAATPGRARELAADIRAFYQGDVLLFPDLDVLPHEAVSPAREIVGERLVALRFLAESRPGVVVTDVAAAMRRLPPRRATPEPLDLSVGQTWEMDALIGKLEALGYRRVDWVEDRGEYSVRGGLVDVMSVADLRPVRVEFLGEEIESLRFFDTETQRSVERVTEVRVLPAAEFVAGERDRSRAIGLLEAQLVEAKARKEMERAEWLASDIERLREGIDVDGMERYQPFFFDDPPSLVDLGAVTLFDETKEILDQAQEYFDESEAFLRHAIDDGTAILPPRGYLVPPEELDREVAIEFVSLTRGEGEVSFAAGAVEPMLGQLERIEAAVHGLTEEGYAIIAALPSKGQAARMAEIMAEILPTSAAPAAPAAEVSFAVADLSHGFIWPDLKVAVLSYGDVFVRPRGPRAARPAAKPLSLTSLSDLKVGDYVVHESHGIARFEGMVRQDIGGGSWDCLVLRYENGRLLVRADGLGKISKYVADVAGPPLNRLGGVQWARVTKRVKGSVREMAKELLALYAGRLAAKGHAFAEDTPWQRELEDAFPHLETADQEIAIEAVKADMEEVKPMDRLVCGDVGFGKTEVAVRAAFKSVMDGRQVLVLAPTTILAQQHLSTFRERYAPFPVFVEVLSRFKSPAEQKAILKKFARGEIDVLIGTHRLLQPDVIPHELGLFIIDEEQRFGVRAKERLKKLRESVDVLTLTATPIPRTLQMSISGIRDLSIIGTPPENRLPVSTHVGRYDEELIKAAIHRELRRSGQVYYVHNRVEEIEAVARKIERLAPNARVGVGHGRMPERRLEQLMIDFLSEEIDILVCTTIVESGLDIPNVNTMIVENADRLGLAQLYHLRGRVGRGAQRAYGYFFFAPGVLKGAAAERLKAISEFTELGSGLRVAMRDLEIRGAGNLLGAEQHGHVAAVGFDYYCELLRRSVAELEGKPIRRVPDVKIDLPVPAYLPEDYVGSELLRLQVYHKMAVADQQGLDEVEIELKDRFGPLPPQTGNLLEICRLRLAAAAAGLTRVVSGPKGVSLSPVRLSPERLAGLAGRKDLKYRPLDGVLVARTAGKELTAFSLRELISDIITAFVPEKTANRKAASER